MRIQYSRIALLTVVTICSSSAVYSQTSNKVWSGKEADIFFLCDSSSSVWVVDFRTLLTFLNSLVSDMDIGPLATRVGVGVYSDDHFLHIPIDNNFTKDTLKSEILKTPYLPGNGYISRALRGLLVQGLPKSKVRPNVPLIAVLFTDGMSRYKQLTADNATLVMKAGITLLTVGISNLVDPIELHMIASDPKAESYFQVSDFEQLQSIRTKLSSRILDVELYQGEEGTCGKKVEVDTVFLFDEHAVGQRDTKAIKTFIHDVTANLSMNSGKARVGVVSKTCHEGDINLGQYITEEKFFNGLDNNEGQEISELFKRVRLLSFLEENGGRPDAKKRIVLLMNYNVVKRIEISREADRARYFGIEVFVIYLGTDYDKGFLTGLASSEENTIFRVSGDELIKTTKDFVRIFCNGL